jgi:hypothetical protein
MRLARITFDICGQAALFSELGDPAHHFLLHSSTFTWHDARRHRQLS